MKNSIFVKFIAFLLCAASLTAIFAGGLGAIGVEVYDLHNTDPVTAAQKELESYAHPVVRYHADIYTREYYGNLNEDDLRALFGNSYDYPYYWALEALEIRDAGNKVVYSINDPISGSGGHTFTVASEYPVVVEKTRKPIDKYEVDIWGTVMADTLNVRESPSADSDLMDQLYYGERVRISMHTTVGGSTWGKVDQGWINLGYVALEEPAVETEVPIIDAAEAKLALVTQELLDVYAEPDEDSEIVSMLDFNAGVWIYETRTQAGMGWGRTDEGWIRLDYVKYVEGELEPTQPPVLEDALPPVLEDALPEPTEAPGAAGVATVPVTVPEGLGEPLYYTDASYISGDYQYNFQLAYYQGPELEVTVWLDESAFNGDEQLITVLYTWRDQFIPLLLAGLVAFAITFVFLCTTAGRKTDGTLRPSGLNRVPLDLYFMAAGSLAAVCCAAAIFVIEEGGFDNSFFYTALGLSAFGIALSILGFLFCLAAQVKAPGRYWWHHSVTGWCVDKLLLVLTSLYRGTRGLLRLLPVVWQWLAVTVGIPFLGAAFFFLCLCSYGFGSFFFFCLFALCVLSFLVLVCYGAYAYGTLMKGARHMAQGDLNHQIPTKHLHGTFREFAQQLNSLGGAARIAAQRQMKSERMKTELITNVSHDIKTPLTSIINFVDLLKKPHTEAEGTAYLDVLDRQSQRLKKLIDDLMEMSKASSGNLTVELGQVDAVEAVNQALGEFSDKLARVNLTPVFRHPEAPVLMRADGRLVWRVLSNVLNNAVKYALPDTRLYIDLMVLQGNAVIAIKNISRDQLNVDAEELMERFVRGDSSRNTEGSGLGLNIAKSLVELQQGQMHLMVDGDLFKVTVILPLD